MSKYVYINKIHTYKYRKMFTLIKYVHINTVTHCNLQFAETIRSQWLHQVANGKFLAFTNTIFTCKFLRLHVIIIISSEYERLLEKLQVSAETQQRTPWRKKPRLQEKVYQTAKSCAYHGNNFRPLNLLNYSDIERSNLCPYTPLGHIINIHLHKLIH